MNILDDHIDEFRNFPEPLRKLVEDELQAGNRVIEFGHGYPAAPCGAYIKLAHPFQSRNRVATAALHFYDRNSTDYSGEFTDSNRHFFVLEPPHPPKQAPDIHAIRAAIEAEYVARSVVQSPWSEPAEPAAQQRVPASFEGQTAAPASIVARFVKSMEMNYDKWREGEGYDLSLLDEASESERQSIEQIILHQSPLNWRDIQALAKVDSSRGRAAMMVAFLNADTQTRMAVHAYAPGLLTEQLRIDSIICALRESEIYYGLSEALDEIEHFHPPAIIHELLRGLMKRDGATACHFAAMLYFLHGKSSSAFDWEQRPFFLRFNTDNLIEREQVVRELCKIIGVDPATCV